MGPCRGTAGKRKAVKRPLKEEAVNHGASLNSYHSLVNNSVLTRAIHHSVVQDNIDHTITISHNELLLHHLIDARKIPFGAFVGQL